jgi:hypothetical protein
MNIQSKVLRVLAIFALLIFSTYALSATTGMVQVSGVVKDMTADSVILKTEKGSLARVPRSAISKKDEANLRPGQKVVAEMKFEDFMKANKDRRGLNKKKAQ